MELDVILPPKAETIAPITITSPGNHAGAAMLQSAICASDNAICYGDNFYDEISSLLDWAINLIERHQNIRSVEEKVLNAALEREPAKWMPELAPPYDLYTASIFSVVYNLPFTAQSFAQQNGRDIWAIARSNIRSSRMMDMISVFPRSHGIFIYRNPMNIVRDAICDNPDSDVANICDAWSATMRDYLSLSSEKVLKLRYEDASDTPDDVIQTIENFTGITGLRADIIARNNEAELLEADQLDDDMIASIKNKCADMLAVYYPEMVSD